MKFTFEDYTTEAEKMRGDLQEHVKYLLKDILIKIVKGVYKHNQSEFHDGNSRHCIAGWLEVLILEELKIPNTYEYIDTKESDTIYDCSGTEEEFHEYSSLIEESYKKNKEGYDSAMNTKIWYFAEIVTGMPNELDYRGCDEIYINSGDIFGGSLKIEEIIKNWNRMIDEQEWSENLKVNI